MPNAICAHTRPFVIADACQLKRHRTDAGSVEVLPLRSRAEFGDDARRRIVVDTMNSTSTGNWDASDESLVHDLLPMQLTLQHSYPLDEATLIRSAKCGRMTGGAVAVMKILFVLAFNASSHYLWLSLLRSLPSCSTP